jgi:hypothetical protein
MFPHSKILTVDDDTEYTPTFIETAILHMPTDGKNVLCFRGTFMDGMYTKWTVVTEKMKSVNLFAKGNAGVFYDSGIFPEDFFDSSVYLRICPTNDDIWFNLWRQRLQINLVVIPLTLYTTNNQEERLWFINEVSNDLMIKKLLDFWSVEVLPETN